MIDWQSSVIQLQDRQVAGRREDRADSPLGPAAIGRLARGDVVENDIAVFAPGQPVAGGGVGEQLGVTFLAERVDRLGVIVMRVLPMAEAVAA